jgi:cytochrome P450
MREMIERQRASEVKDDRYDLFSGLMDSSEGDDTGMTDDEIIGTYNVNIFQAPGTDSSLIQGTFMSSCPPGTRYI